MVRYVTMKRITQIFASILFVITVLSIYLAFDFTINNAIARKTASRRRVSHVHPHEQIKTTVKRSLNSSNSQVFKRSNSTYRRFDNNDEHYQRIKAKNPLQGKPGSFHKGRTGVKVNKPPILLRNNRKNLTATLTATTTIIKPFRRDKRYQ